MSESLQIIGVSLLGAALCAGALFWLKREYYQFEKISKKQIEEGKCPWCQAPIKGTYCYSCGQNIWRKPSCPHYGNSRPLLVPYCSHCDREIS